MNLKKIKQIKNVKKVERQNIIKTIKAEKKTVLKQFVFDSH